MQFIIGVEMIVKNAKYYRDWRLSTRVKMVESMGGECQCCGYDRSIYGFDFHHIDPATKEMSLSGNKMNKKNWPQIVKELRKCVLLCRCCHAEIH